MKKKDRERFIWKPGDLILIKPGKQAPKPPKKPKPKKSKAD